MHGILFDRLLDLQEALADLLQRPVDVLPADGLRNPYFIHFIRSIEPDKNVIYAAA